MLLTFTFYNWRDYWIFYRHFNEWFFKYTLFNTVKFLNSIPYTSCLTNQDPIETRRIKSKVNLVRSVSSPALQREFILSKRQMIAPLICGTCAVIHVAIFQILRVRLTCSNQISIYNPLSKAAAHTCQSVSQSVSYRLIPFSTFIQHLTLV